jgi:hypothetical protein
MGMFDTVKSSYQLGEQFTNVICHTKDIDDYIGGTLTDYWINPSGELWYSSYSETHSFEIIEKDDPEYSEKSFLNFRWIPTGKHGKFVPHKITKYVQIYPANWKGDWEDLPRCRLHFVDGVLKDFKDITNCRKTK